MKTAFTFLAMLLLALPSMGEVHLSMTLGEKYGAYSSTLLAETPEDTRLSTSSAIWQTYGYYGIYKTGCVALGMTAMGIASGFFIGGIFSEVLGGGSYAEKEYRRGKVIMWTGIAATYGLAFFGPKIVAHNLHQDDPNAPYDEILQSGLIAEAACNAVGIGFLALGWSIEEGFLADALIVAGFLCFFVPAPAVMHSTYNNCEPAEPLNAMNMRFGAVSFGIADYTDGSRDYSFKIDLANAIDYQ